MKLGTLLLRNAAIGLSQLEAALRNQVLYGGRLGADEAHRLRAIPLGMLETGGAAVAMVDPSDVHAVESLAARLGASITPYVVPELRALYYLEKHFGTPRRARFVRTARTGTDPGEVLVGDDRRRSQPAGGIAMPPTLTLEPRRRRASQAPLPHAVPPALTFAAACERIDTANGREQIADAFVDYAKGRCDALVVLLIRAGNALGWRGYVAPPLTLTRPDAEQSLPLGGASALQAAHD